MWTFTLLCFAGCLAVRVSAFGVVSGASIGSEQATAHSRSSAYHPGHRPLHVTRLHRYEHSGLAAFVEQDASWHSGKALEDDQPSAAAGTEDGTRAQSFVKLSPVQADALRLHHLTASQKAVHAGEVFLQGRTVARAASGRENHFTARMETLERPSLAEQEALKKFARHHTGVRSGRASTGLSSLSGSQYVGPIGVGTTFTPPGCKMPERSLLHLEGELTAANAEGQRDADADGVPVCTAADQAKMWVVFDTGSTNIWISSDLCERGACAEEDRQRYNHTKSVTFNYPKHATRLGVEFGTGTLSGPVGKDDLHIGPFAVFQQTFGMIQDQTGTVFEEVPFEGIVGLAFPAMSANRVTPFFDTVIGQKALEHNEFSFYFSRYTPAANAIFWGGVEPGFYKGVIEYFPVVDPYYWGVELHSFKIGDECLLGSDPECTAQPAEPQGFFSAFSFVQLDQKSQSSNAANDWSTARARQMSGEPNPPKAILDSGTTYFTAEKNVYEEIMQRIPIAPCSEVTGETHKPLTYTLKSAAGNLRDFVFTHDMYMAAKGTGEQAECLPAFMQINVPKQHGPAMVLGDVFFRYYYAVFDRADGEGTNARLGLAPSLHTKDVLQKLRTLTHDQPSFQQAHEAKLRM